MACKSVGIIGLAIAFLSLSRAIATPVPALDLPDLVRRSDLIAVGRVISVQEAGPTTIEGHGQPIPARRMLAWLQVSRILKGQFSETAIPLEFIIPETFLGYAAISASQFGMFFLRKSEARGYVAANCYYPFLVASTSTPAVEESDLDRVIAEIAQVLAIPGPSEERKRAIQLLASVKSRKASAALRAATEDADAAVRIQASAALLAQGDASTLSAVGDILVNPPQNTDPGLLRTLAFAIEAGVKSKESIPVLGRLLRSGDVQTRRAAAAALQHTEAESAIEWLSTAIEDTDREVRYHAVLGLAVITGQDEWGPSLDLFEREEQKYLNHWREWVKTR